MRFAATAVLVLLPLMATAADIYRCPMDAGKVEFRDRPCDGGLGTKIDVQPNSAGMSAEEVYAKTKEMRTRQAVRQEAENRANAYAWATGQQEARDAQYRSDQAELLATTGRPPGSVGSLRVRRRASPFQPAPENWI